MIISLKGTKNMTKLLAGADLADMVMDSTAQLLANLADRWKDEAEYEDWLEYVNVMREYVNKLEGVEFVSMSKRPFAFVWKGHDGFTRTTRLTRNAIETLRHN